MPQSVGGKCLPSGALYCIPRNPLFGSHPLLAKINPFKRRKLRQEWSG